MVGNDSHVVGLVHSHTVGAKGMDPSIIWDVMRAHSREHIATWLAEVIATWLAITAVWLACTLATLSPRRCTS